MFSNCRVRIIRNKMQPIGLIKSCFKEKFGIPRQSGLIPTAEASLQLLPPYACAAAVRGLEEFSHIWIIFLFHALPSNIRHPTVRPPRLGGNRRIGVFASRSPFRPNAIGISAVRLLGIDKKPDKKPNDIILHLGGVDLLDGTPVLDIKPYLPYTDAIPNAHAGFAQLPPQATIQVCYAATAKTFLETLEPPIKALKLRNLITEIIAYDPRPATSSKISFGMRLLEYEVSWIQETNIATVTDIVPVNVA